MKKIIILSVLFALSATVTAHAQIDTVTGYKSIFGHESTVWNVMMVYLDDYNGYNYIMRSSIDTSVNDNIYKKIEVYFYNNIVDTEYLEQYILLREDTTTGKVWFRCIGDDRLEYEIGIKDTDFLIMDMSMEIGDSILLFLVGRQYSYSILLDWFFVSAIDTINNSKTIHLHDKYNHEVEFIEGIGGSNLFDAIEPWHLYSALVCCHKDGELVYHKAAPYHSDENCIIPYVGIENSAIESSVSIYPNPCGDYIIIKGDNIQQATIYDMEGRVVCPNICMATTIDIKKLHAGVYFLKIISNHEITIKTIIKK